MKILLINNHTLHLHELNASLAGHQVEVQSYEPGLDFHEEGKDLIILSGGGGEGLEIDDFIQKGKLWYEDQMEFILRTKKPIMGICMGFEVIAKAFGRDVTFMGDLVEGQTDVKLSSKGEKLIGVSSANQFESHSWQVTEAPKDFDTLGDSPLGVQIMKHRTRKILATQFHPEKGGTLELKEILALP